jgi:hypothetical protein
MLVDSTGVAKYDVMATSPGPILVADFEGGAHKFPRPVTYWAAAEVAAGSFPKGLTPESIVVTVPDNYTEFKALAHALHAPVSPFVSFWIDSATVLTQVGEIEIVRKKANTQQGFGDLLNFLRPELTTLKQIASRPDTKLEVFGATAWQRDDKIAPSMQGSIAGWFNNMLDIVGYCSIEVIDSKLANRMRIFPAPAGTDPKARGTKEMYIKYGESIVNPNIAALNEENK